MIWVFKNGDLFSKVKQNKTKRMRGLHTEQYIICSNDVSCIEDLFNYLWMIFINFSFEFESIAAFL